MVRFRAREAGPLSFTRTPQWLTAPAVTIALAGVVVAVAARTRLQVTRPLGRLVMVINRLAAGEPEVRADAESGAAVVRRMAQAINTLTDEARTAREVGAELARLNAAARQVGVRIREHLTVEPALDEAARGLATMLAADYVVIRCGEPDGDSATGCWRRPDIPGSPDVPAEAGTDWVLHRPSDRWSTDDLRSAGPAPLRPEQRAALLALGAGPVLVIPIDAGPQLSGVATLCRSAVAGPWSTPEIEVAHSVVGGLGRGLLQAQLYEREHDVVERLQRLDEAKTEFMWTISHELRTPLASITGFVESLRDGDVGPVGEKQDRMLEVIQRNAKRLRTLIDDMLMLSRVEAERLPTERHSTDLAELIQSAVAAIGSAASRAGVTVESRIDTHLRAHLDADQIDRMVMNLLSNAVKFTPPDGRVTVTAVREGDDVVIAVADTGIGVPDADKENLFTRFFRCSNAVSRVIPGTGLGLAIVQTIVANHDGVIDFTSAEGQGTTVTVRLPA